MRDVNLEAIKWERYLKSLTDQEKKSFLNILDRVMTHCNKTASNAESRGKDSAYWYYTGIVAAYNYLYQSLAK